MLFEFVDAYDRIGKNKKQAEQMAAKEALRLMGAEI